MKTVAMALIQVRYVNKAFWRNPASAFFTFAFPLMFLVIFTSLLGHGIVEVGGHLVHQSTYYVGSMAAFAVISARYTSIAIGVTIQRDAGILKRTNGTPLPGSAYLGARVLHAPLIAVLLVVITATFGRVLYRANLPTGVALMHFVVMLCIGAASFTALGFAITTLIPNAEASAGHRQREHSALTISVRHLHLARRQGAHLDSLDRSSVSGKTLRRRNTGRLPRNNVPLERRCSGRGLGSRRRGTDGEVLFLAASQIESRRGLTWPRSPPTCSTLAVED